jgi:hypothetical protein
MNYRSAALWVLFVVAALGAYVNGSASAASPPSTVKSSVPASRSKGHEPPYRSDSRFDRIVKVEPGPHRLADLGESVGDQVVATIRIDPRLRGHRIVVAVEKLSASQVLDAVTAAFGVTCVKVRDVYVLVSDAGMAEVAALSETEWIREIGKVFNGLMASLTPAQQKTLSQTGSLELKPAETRGRQNACLRLLAQLSTGQPWSRGVEGFQNGRGVSLRIKTDSSGGNRELGLYLPLVGGGEIPVLSKPLQP